MKRSDFTDTMVEIVKDALDQVLSEGSQVRVETLDEMTKDHCSCYDMVRTMLLQATDDMRSIEYD